MTIALLVTSSASLLIFAILGLSWFRSQRCLRGRYRSAVVVTLKGTATGGFRGVLVDGDADYLVLRNAESLSAAGDRVVIDGEVLIDRREVAYLQRP